MLTAAEVRGSKKSKISDWVCFPDIFITNKIAEFRVRWTNQRTNQSLSAWISSYRVKQSNKVMQSLSILASHQHTDLSWNLDSVHQNASQSTSVDWVHDLWNYFHELLMKITKNNGPINVPWGMSRVTGAQTMIGNGSQNYHMIIICCEESNHETSLMSISSHDNHIRSIKLWYFILLKIVAW